MNQRIVKTMTYHALNPEGDAVFSCSVEFDRRQWCWVVFDPRTGKAISEHSLRVEAVAAAERQCEAFL